MQFIHRLWTFLSAFGVDASYSQEFSNKVKSTNQITILLFFIALPYVFIFYYLDSILAIPVICIELFFILVLFFNKYRFHLFSKLLLLTNANFGAFFYAFVLGKESGVHLLLIVFAGLSIVIFEPEKQNGINFGIFLPVFLQIILQFLPNTILMFDFPFQYLKYVNTTAVFAVTLLSTLYIKIFNATFLEYIQKLKSSNQNLEYTYGELREAFQELKESKQIQEIMSNQAAYSQLVNGVAHEFKNPLHLMRARAEVTLERLDLDEDQKKLGEMVVKQVDRLDSILKPMLVYGRQNMARKRVKFDLKEIVDDLSELAGPRCVKSKIQYVKPEVPAKVFVAYADKDYVFQSVLNVFVNALQFTPEKGCIALSVGKGEYLDPQRNVREGVWIVVQDTGSGISPDRLPYIFDPYSTSKKDPKNVGLGLSIVQRAILENEGHVDVESEVGVGTLFRLWVPVGPDVKKTV